MTIVYIPGEDNSVADALSRVPNGAFPGKSVDKQKLPFSLNTIRNTGVHATLSITTDPSDRKSVV